MEVRGGTETRAQGCDSSCVGVHSNSIQEGLVMISLILLFSVNFPEEKLFPFQP
jgi:hypothetical protein